METTSQSEFLSTIHSQRSTLHHLPSLSSLSSIPPVITGLGCVTALGSDRESTWRGLLAGQRRGRRLSPDDFHGLADSSWGELRFLGAPAAVPPNGDEPLAALLALAAGEAAREARLEAGGFDPCRAGCVIASSKGEIVGLGHMARDGASIRDWTSLWPGSAGAGVARAWNLAGPRLAPVAACATGLLCLLRARDLIEQGRCDLVVAGVADASLHPGVLAAFDRMGVLAPGNGDPAGACRPFQIDRKGFFVGEGAAIFVMERREHALARGVRPLASWRGGSMVTDPSGLTRLAQSGAPLAAAVRQALDQAGLIPGEIGHIHLHGTATRLGDRAEAAGLETVFGASLGNIPCVAVKPAIGHVMGASGAVELAIATMAVSRSQVPPTIVQSPIDPGCALPLATSPAGVEGYALKISLGFGGHIAAACLGPG